MAHGRAHFARRPPRGPELRGRARHRVRRAAEHRLRLPAGARVRDPDVRGGRRPGGVGVPALRCRGAEPGRASTREAKVEKPVRTHWDMLLERRSIKELEEILTERLELLRGGEIGPAHLHRPSKKKAKTRLSASQPVDGRRATQSTTSPRTTPSGPGRCRVRARASGPCRARLVAAARPGPARNLRVRNRVSALRATGRVNGSTQNEARRCRRRSPGSAAACRRPGSGRRRRARGPASAGSSSASRSAAPGPAALALHQPAAQEAVGDQQQHGPPGADHLADLDQHVDLERPAAPRTAAPAPTRGPVASSAAPRARRSTSAAPRRGLREYVARPDAAARAGPRW